MFRIFFSLKGIMTLAFRIFQKLLIMIIYNKEMLMKNSSKFCSLKLDVWSLNTPSDKMIALQFHEHFSPSVSHKTVTQSAEIHIFMGETRRSHIYSHYVSSLGHVPGQPDRTSRAEWVVWCSLCGRPPGEAEWWPHWENENSPIKKCLSWKWSVWMWDQWRYCISNTLLKRKAIFH